MPRGRFVCPENPRTDGRRPMSAALSQPIPLEQDTARERAGEELPAPARSMAQAVIELGAARKKILMYPAGHAQVRQAVERALCAIEQILCSRPEVTFAADQDCLLVHPDSIPLDDPPCREFSSLLRDWDVAAIRFRRGLSFEELDVFLSRIAQNREGILAEGGLEKALLRAGVQHIRVLNVDYTKFLHTEEEEVEKQTSPGVQGSRDWLWRSFVAHLIQGTLTDSKRGVPVQSAADLSPRQLAAYLNEERLDTEKALEIYESTIREHLEAIPASEEERQRLRTRSFQSLRALLEELQPAIRRQFLSATYRQCEDRKDSPLVEHLLGGISRGLVVEMLRNANQAGNEISPTLLNLVRKIASSREGTTSSEGEPETGRNPAAAAAAEPDPDQRRQVEELFRRETYETYVTADYASILEDLSANAVPSRQEDELPREVQALLGTLEARHLNTRIARAWMAFLARTARAEEYRDYAEKIFSITHELLAEGEFSLPLEVLRMFERDCRERADESLRSIAEEFLKKFQDPGFVSKTLAAFDKWRNEAGSAAEAFLRAIGPASVPQVLGLYLKRSESEETEHLVRLLAPFPDRVAAEAVELLRSRLGASLVRLVVLVRRLDLRSLADALRPLLDHHDRRVRLEVLEALVKFRHPDSVELLSQALGSREPEDLLRAIDIAGLYRVEPVAPLLASMVRIFPFSRLDCQKNEKLLGALANLADPCALPVLERVARARWSLYPKQLEKLKRLAFQSLRSYDPARIGTLLKIGFRSRDPTIQSICRECTRKQAGSAVEG